MKKSQHGHHFIPLYCLLNSTVRNLIFVKNGNSHFISETVHTRPPIKVHKSIFQDETMDQAAESFCCLRSTFTCTSAPTPSAAPPPYAVWGAAGGAHVVTLCPPDGETPPPEKVNFSARLLTFRNFPRSLWAAKGTNDVFLWRLVCFGCFYGDVWSPCLPETNSPGLYFLIVFGVV